MAFRVEDLLKYADPTAHVRFVKKLPPKIQARTRALVAFEEEHKQLRAACEKELRELEEKYAALYKPVFEEREKVIAGKFAVTQEQVDKGKEYLLKKAESGDDSDDEELPPKPEISNKLTDKVSEGIPDFWVTALENHPVWAELVSHECDRPILSHLTNITCDHDVNGFRLSFHFSENEYFENKVLTKTYKVEPSDFDMDDVTDIIGDEIKWKEGKNVTVKSVKTKVKGKQTRMVEKVKQQESFFNFFSMTIKESEMHDDFELATCAKEQIIPRAIEWFCDEFADDDDEEEEEEELEENEEDEEDTNEGKKTEGEKNEECKQQ